MSQQANASSNSPTIGQSLAWWRTFPWLVALALVGIIVWMRWMSALTDNGMVNVITYLLAIAAWVLVILGLFLSAQAKLAAWLISVPIVALGVFLCFYRWERMDSEIIPQFAWRWSPPPTLPAAPAEMAKSNGPAQDLPARFQRRATDYPEFMGSRRTGSFATLELETDWASTPPKIIWKQPIGEGWSSFAVQGDAAVTMEQRDREEWVSCYDANSGQLLWHYAIPSRHANPMGGTGPRATPTIYNDRVYSLSAVSQMVCLELATGDKLWSVELLEKSQAQANATAQADFEADVSWGRSGSPLIVDNKVIVPLGGLRSGDKQSLIALDASDGQELWRAGNEQISYSSPVLVNIHGQAQILFLSENSLTAFEPGQGKPLWSVPWQGSSSSNATVSQPLLLDDGQRILLSKGYGSGAKLIEVSRDGDHWSTQSLWENTSVLRTKFTSCVVHRDHAYGLSDGILECVDLSNGQRAWKKGRYRHGQLLLIGEHLLITAEDGALVVVAADPKQHRELARLPVIGDVTWNTPALSGDRLLMRNSSEAACLQLPLRSSLEPQPSK